MNFIKEYTVSKSICKKLIKYYEASPHKETLKDQIRHMNYIFVNSSNPIIAPYLQQLTKAIEKYKEAYPVLYTIPGLWRLYENIKIQKYDPGQSYFSWHCERSGNTGDVTRVLVFMTYLNTVESGGETEWRYQKYITKPVEGSTVIWPAEWTHEHRGKETKQTKYIITGWYNYD